MKLRNHTMLRKAILSSVLLISAFAHSASLSSPAFHGVYEPGRDGALAYAFAQTPALELSGFDSNYKLSLPKPVQDKNFYLLSLFQRNPSVRRLLSQNEVLRKVSTAKSGALKKTATCDNVDCIDQLIRFDDSAIAAVAAELQTLANKPELRMLAQTDLRPSGVFIKYNNQSDAQMLVAAWKDAANGLNRILSVYGLGKDPRYKDIDRVSYDVSTEEYRKLLKAKLAEIKFTRAPLFFEPTLNFAIKLLEINRRDEAGRYEPLEQGENKAAVQNLRKIEWSDYPYSFILVLGSGGRDLTTTISPIGAQRTDVAAQLFFQHKAPLIIVSGGFVHPMQTPYCEAIEMKKYLMEKYKIPETGILIEPHARHTTTNFRNAARLAFRYRLPADRTALVTSSEDHITSSVNDDFRTRNINELGYFPMEFIKRISPTEAEFKPSITSLFFDAEDPLDP
jgi:hypothetical protein